MDVKGKACCFSGNRVENMNCSIELIESALSGAIDKAIFDGFDTFYHGGGIGIDLIAAELVIARRAYVKNTNALEIQLIGVLPYEEQAKYWGDGWRERYYNVLAKCDDVITLHRRYEKGRYHEGYRYMLDRSQRLIAVCDGRACGRTRNDILYARRKNLDIQMLSI